MSSVGPPAVAAAASVPARQESFKKHGIPSTTPANEVHPQKSAKEQRPEKEEDDDSDDSDDSDGAKEGPSGQNSSARGAGAAAATKGSNRDAAPATGSSASGPTISAGSSVVPEAARTRAKAAPQAPAPAAAPAAAAPAAAQSSKAAPLPTPSATASAEKPGTRTATPDDTVPTPVPAKISEPKAEEHKKPKPVEEPLPAPEVRVPSLPSSAPADVNTTKNGSLELAGAGRPATEGQNLSSADSKVGSPGPGALVPVDPAQLAPWSTVPSSSVSLAPLHSYPGVMGAAGPPPPGLLPAEEVVSVALTFRGRRKLVRHGSSTRVGQILELHPSLMRTGKAFALVDSEGFEIGKELTLSTLSRGGGNLVELEVQEEMW